MDFEQLIRRVVEDLPHQYDAEVFVKQGYGRATWVVADDRVDAFVFDADVIHFSYSIGYEKGQCWCPHDELQILSAVIESLYDQHEEVEYTVDDEPPYAEEYAAEVRAGMHPGMEDSR